MKKLQNQLKTLSKSIVSLSGQVERIKKEVDKLQPSTTAAKKKKAPAIKPAAKKKKTASTTSTVLESVFDIIKRGKNGVPIAKIKEKVGLTSKQLSNSLYKLSKRGKIIAKERGIYFKK